MDRPKPVVQGFLQPQEYHVPHLVVHLYVVEDVEELLPCLDLVERNRHDVALGVVRNCLGVEATKDFQENNFKKMASLYAEQANYF
jgi:hypothetical protein